jgi:hypothetical protein
MSDLAPIAIFAYRRADTLAQVLDALERCPEFPGSPVFIFSDGPKSATAANDVAAVRALVKARLRANMRLIEAPQNAGLARSIISGVGRLCEEYGRVIVIEDDLIVSPFLLGWFNQGLDRFVDEPRVMQISGHMFAGDTPSPNDHGVFLPMTTSWGWATWKRAWDQFDPDAKGWAAVRADRALRRRFDLDGTYPYARMLERQMNGQVDSWAIRWYWTVFNLGGLGLFPPKTLVLNVGDDALATHGGVRRLIRKVIRRPDTLADRAPSLPSTVEIDPSAWRRVKRNIMRSRF